MEEIVCSLCADVEARRLVQFDCACRDRICLDCALLHIAARKRTYEDGVQCPFCRSLTKIEGLADCAAEETLLVDRARDFLGIRIESRSGNGIFCVLRAFLSSGYEGTISLADLNSKEYQENPREYQKIVRLDVARIQKALEDKMTHFSPSSLPIGPLSNLIVKCDVMNCPAPVFLETLVDSEFTCLKCSTIIVNNCVKFDCNCRAILCVNCGLRSLAEQEGTYIDGIKCPECPRFKTVVGVFECAAEEKTLIDAATKFFRRRTTMSDGDLLTSLLQSFKGIGLQGVVKLTDRNKKQFRNREFNHVLKLDIARLERARQDGTVNSLPMGPLALLTVEQSVLVESNFNLSNGPKKRTSNVVHVEDSPQEKKKSHLNQFVSPGKYWTEE